MFLLVSINVAAISFRAYLSSPEQLDNTYTYIPFTSRLFEYNEFKRPSA